VEYVRPYLYPKQSDAFFLPIRYILCEASTKAGKTVGAIAWILEEAFKLGSGQNCWWVAPVSSQAEIAYRRIKNNLTKGSFTSKDSPTPVITLAHGPMIWFKSGDNPDSLFGEDVFAAVVDEASRCKEESWYALRSTLTATQGKCRFIGNVKGRKNWFYRLARLAESGDWPDARYIKITVLDAIEAGVIPQSEIEDARLTLPEDVFRELYMAEASDDAGNPFGLSHIQACVGRLSDAPPAAFGIDLAKKHDYLVVIGLDAEGKTCVFQRWKGLPWRQSIRRIHEIVGEDVPALVDSTGIGDPILEELQVGHGNFSGYMFSQVGKQRLMEGLAVSIQGREITFPDGPIKSELESFEYEYTRTGVRYSAPEGLNDDCVCSLALARERWTAVSPGQNLIHYYADAAKQATDDSEVREEEEDFANRFAKRPAPAVFDNELTQLYLSTLAQYETEDNVCARCGTRVTNDRISDGDRVWHTHCRLVGFV
jgi:hypothetical protein